MMHLSLPSAVRRPRPIFCTNRMRLLVGCASMMHRTSRSTPVVKTPTLQRIFVSPDRNRANISFRVSPAGSGFVLSSPDGVAQSMMIATRSAFPPAVVDLKGEFAVLPAALLKLFGEATSTPRSQQGFCVLVKNQGSPVDLSEAQAAGFCQRVCGRPTDAVFPAESWDPVGPALLRTLLHRRALGAHFPRGPLS